MRSPEPTRALRDLTDHRHYRYRACAPLPQDVADFPGQSLGDPELSVDAWSASSEDGGEPQKERLAREQAAKQACATCPVLTECRTYALTEDTDGHLAEPDGIWGGMLSLERHRHLIELRHAQHAPMAGPSETDLAECRTPQKQRLLASLARETDEELVAYRAGMDVRLANFHRSGLCGLLGLDREHATRAELLAAARHHRVLPAGARVRPDGPFPIAAAPNTEGTRQRRIAPQVLKRPRQLLLFGATTSTTGGEPRTPAASPTTGRTPARPLLRVVPALPEQLALPITTNHRLEPAA